MNAVKAAKRLGLTRLIPKAPLTTYGGDSHEWRFLTPVQEIYAMPSARAIGQDYSAEELRTTARRSKDVSQSRRLLSLAAVRDGMDRAAAAKIGGMDRQTLRDWVHRFNALGPEGLIDTRTEGPKPRLSEEQLAQFAKIVEAGPDREKDGVVRWRRVDLKRVIAESSASNFIRAMSKASEEARLLAHQRPAAPSGSGRADRRGV